MSWVPPFLSFSGSGPGSGGLNPLGRLGMAALLSGVLGMGAYLNSLQNGFAYDDHHIILENEAVHSLQTLPDALFLPYWPGEHGSELGLWRPVATTVYALEWALWGDHPLGYHLVNILLHGVVTALVVLLLGELIPVAGALAGGLLFAVHSVHVEAVANVVGSAEILAALFFLWACLLILRGGEVLGAGRQVGILLLFGLGLLTKESAVTLPGIVLLLDSSRNALSPRDLPGYLRRRWALYAGFVGVAGLILLARHAVLGTVAKPFAPMGAHLLEEIPRIWTAAASWPHLVRLMVFPADLIADYGPDVIPVTVGWSQQAVLGAVMVLALLLLALASWRGGEPMKPDRVSDRAFGWAAVWMVVTLSPTSNLFFLSGIILSERTLYLPSVGFALLGGWGVLRLARVRPRLAPALLGGAILALAARSWVRTPTWKDNVTVSRTLVAQHPESGRAQWLIGDSYMGENRVSAALTAYRYAVGTLDNHYTLLTESAAKLLGRGHDRLVEFLLLRAWSDSPEFPRAPGLLANLYDRQGRFREAEAAARASLALNPDQVVQHHFLARALEGQGLLEEAIRERLTVIRMGEGNRWEQWRWLAELRVQAGDSAGAGFALDSARIRAPSPEVARQIDSIRGVLTPGSGG